MKKLLAVAALMTSVALSGCSTTATNTDTSSAVSTATSMGMNIFKTAVDTQCRNELESQTAWSVASVAMNPEQEEAAKTKICGCVSEQAPQQLTMVEMTNAALDSEYRSQLVTEVVAESLQTCYASFTQ